MLLIMKSLLLGQTLAPFMLLSRSAAMGTPLS